jgi:DNA helicase-2/ATP-dependent DNA helicase PcrA
MASFLETNGKDLNEQQREAVAHTDGPVLLLAGAGSGKTRVLTYRIAHLIYDHQVPLHQILAMTFSNKAAREMHDRVKKLIGDESEARLPWVSTFHSTCARLLRMYGDRLGYKNDYVIYDSSEQKGMIKRTLEHLKISKQFSPDAVLARISTWKNDAMFPEQAKEAASLSFDRLCADVYAHYSREMFKAHAMDFDDLLLNTYKLFRENDDIKEHYRNFWKYVLIDEFQDTNRLQNKLVMEILNPQQNICVVGDDDQSIYGWRGAKIDNILKFDDVFKDCKVIKLEQNYRSTGNILKAAASVISKNEMRHDKTLWTNEGQGAKIKTAALSDDRSEARYVVSEIKKLINEGKSAEEIAVFYRVNSLSRNFEEECLRHRVPYRLVGGFRFYERKEIKDILGYLRLLLNPADIMSFRRTINMPLRGIGKASVEKLEALSIFDEKPIGKWLVETDPLPLKGKAKAGAQTYIDFLNWGFKAIDKEDSLVDLFSETLRLSKYVQVLEAQKTEENLDRIQNIQELLSAVQEFEEIWAPSEDMDPTTPKAKQKLRDFLERVSLMADVDSMVEGEKQVTFMSFHAAKGLEFDICFLTAMEEGLFPSSRSFDNYEQTEEERRLCYVGITRAKKQVYLTRASSRRAFGTINYNVASRFFKDLPEDVLESTIDEDQEDNYDSYSYGSSLHSNTWAYSQAGAKKKKAQKKQAEEADPWGSFDFDQSSDDPDAFHKGDHVVHPSFGEGVIRKKEMLGNDECLSIVFYGRGMKKVLSKFVNKKQATA